jgi:hypothetical protein
VRNASGGASDGARRAENQCRLSRLGLRGIDHRRPSRDVGHADPRSLFKTQVLWQREHGDRGDREILRVAAVPPEAEIPARTEHRLTRKFIRSFNDYAGEIAARNPWNGGFMHLTLHVFDIARVDGRRLYLYQYCPARRSWHWHFLDLQTIHAAGLIKL